MCQYEHRNRETLKNKATGLLQKFRICSKIFGSKNLEMDEMLEKFKTLVLK
jgi:hypothetical protein